MGKRLRNGIVILFFLAVATSASALSPCADLSRFSPEIQRILADYEAGWSGDDEALARFIDSVDNSWLLDPVLRAYYGSACVAGARLVPDRHKRRWLQRGAAHLDAAVKLAPEQLQVRLLRAVTYAILPRLAGRMETVETDFAILVEKADSADQLDEGCRQAVFYHAGTFALRNRDPRAADLLQRAAELKPENGIEPDRIHRMLRAAEELEGDS